MKDLSRIETGDFLIFKSGEMRKVVGAGEKLRVERKALNKSKPYTIYNGWQLVRDGCRYLPNAYGQDLYDQLKEYGGTVIPVVGCPVADFPDAREITEDDHDYIAGNYGRMSIPDLAAELDLTQKMVRNYIRSKGIKRNTPKKYLSVGEKAYIKAHYKKQTIDQLKAKCNTDPIRVDDYVATLNGIRLKRVTA